VKEESSLEAWKF